MQARGNLRPEEAAGFRADRYYDKNGSQRYHTASNELIQHELTLAALRLISVPSIATYGLVDVDPASVSSAAERADLEAAAAALVAARRARKKPSTSNGSAYYSTTFDDVRSSSSSSSSSSISNSRASSPSTAVRSDEKPRCFVLDLGCGSGFSARTLVQHHEEHDTRPFVIGCDVSADMLRHAQTYAKKHQLHAHTAFVLCDFGQPFPFRDSLFDKSISISAVQWLNTEQKQQNLFHHLHRCLVPRARACLQYYPTTQDEVEAFVTMARANRLRATCVMDMPHKTLKRKWFLCLQHPAPPPSAAASSNSLRSTSRAAAATSRASLQEDPRRSADQSESSSWVTYSSKKHRRNMERAIAAATLAATGSGSSTSINPIANLDSSSTYTSSTIDEVERSISSSNMFDATTTPEERLPLCELSEPFDAPCGVCFKEAVLFEEMEYRRAVDFAPYSHTIAAHRNGILLNTNLVPTALWHYRAHGHIAVQLMFNHIGYTNNEFSNRYHPLQLKVIRGGLSHQQTVLAERLRLVLGNCPSWQEIESALPDILDILHFKEPDPAAIKQRQERRDRSQAQQAKRSNKSNATNKSNAAKQPAPPAPLTSFVESQFAPLSAATDSKLSKSERAKQAAKQAALMQRKRRNQQPPSTLSQQQRWHQALLDHTSKYFVVGMSLLILAAVVFVSQLES